MSDKEYVDSLENLLIFTCESYMMILNKLLELGHTENNKAYMKVPTIQGSGNRIPMRQLGELQFEKPQHGFKEVYEIISEKRNLRKD
ncbi:hypothetical protein [Bacillus paralicheniformis]|uniref:hypothetical protein n=1 Tax=Bacillus paralicheniformis TaxID=1648923 RepID=UPI000BA72BB4|nr:hypothetical protein [Bacillus paralicheniformis]MEC0684958.1 hypothetical protein [Bacillus haynesii]PAC96336.1 hypothetical protein CHH86_14835 [Bacillus paralicheniformis]